MASLPKTGDGWIPDVRPPLSLKMVRRHPAQPSPTAPAYAWVRDERRPAVGCRALTSEPPHKKKRVVIKTSPVGVCQEGRLQPSSLVALGDTAHAETLAVPGPQPASSPVDGQLLRSLAPEIAKDVSVLAAAAAAAAAASDEDSKASQSSFRVRMIYHKQRALGCLLREPSSKTSPYVDTREWVAAKDLKHRRLKLSDYRVKDESAAICVMCESADSFEGNWLIFCDGPCQMAYHQRCYGLTRLPPGDWFCSDRCLRGEPCHSVALARLACLERRRWLRQSRKRRREKHRRQAGPEAVLSSLEGFFSTPSLEQLEQGAVPLSALDPADASMVVSLSRGADITHVGDEPVASRATPAHFCVELDTLMDGSVKVNEVPDVECTLPKERFNLSPAPLDWQWEVSHVTTAAAISNPAEHGDADAAADSKDGDADERTSRDLFVLQRALRDQSALNARRRVALVQRVRAAQEARAPEDNQHTREEQAALEDYFIMLYPPPAVDSDSESEGDDDVSKDVKQEVKQTLRYVVSMVDRIEKRRLAKQQEQRQALQAAMMRKRRLKAEEREKKKSKETEARKAALRLKVKLMKPKKYRSKSTLEKVQLIIGRVQQAYNRAERKAGEGWDGLRRLLGSQPKAHPVVVHASGTKLYCKCQEPFDDAQFYIACDLCNNWYHGTCVGVNKSMADWVKTYVCPPCHFKNNRPGAVVRIGTTFRVDASPAVSVSPLNSGKHRSRANGPLVRLRRHPWRVVRRDLWGEDDPSRSTDTPNGPPRVQVLPHASESPKKLLSASKKARMELGSRSMPVGAKQSPTPITTQKPQLSLEKAAGVFG